MSNQDQRTEMLIGRDCLQILKQSRVAVFGVGGVGGYAVEALARAGVGAIDIFDNDTISESNINRQIIATHESVGMLKTDAFEKRILSINPECRVKKHTLFVTPEIIDALDLSVYSYVADAIDTVTAKIALAVKCESEKIKLISSMGTGNKLDPLAFEVSDIYKTSVCPLARVMRYELKKRGVKKLKVVFSKEEPIKPQPRADGERVPPASISFVPPAAGLIIASEIIRELISPSYKKTKQEK